MRSRAPLALAEQLAMVVIFALCAAVLPNAKDVGKDMGVFQLALSIPSIVVPLVAPSILAIGGGHNYLLLWGMCGVLCALGAVAVFKVKGAR